MARSGARRSVGHGVAEAFQFLVGRFELRGLGLKLGVQFADRPFGLLALGDVLRDPNRNSGVPCSSRIGSFMVCNVRSPSRREWIDCSGMSTSRPAASTSRSFARMKSACSAGRKSRSSFSDHVLPGEAQQIQSRTVLRT